MHETFKMTVCARTQVHSYPYLPLSNGTENRYDRQEVGTSLSVSEASDADLSLEKVARPCDWPGSPVVLSGRHPLLEVVGRSGVGILLSRERGV